MLNPFLLVSKSKTLQLFYKFNVKDASQYANFTVYKLLSSGRCQMTYIKETFLVTSILCGMAISTEQLRHCPFDVSYLLIGINKFLTGIYKFFLNNDFLSLPCIRICYFLMEINRTCFFHMILLILIASN